MTRMTGARAVVEQLKREGVRHAFTVPGESFLSVLDALYDEPAIALIATRHESGAGDGGFLMTGNELETAVRGHLPVIALVFNNCSYGTIRMHQEREFPGRVSATTLGPVDFAKFAESLGAHGTHVTHSRDFAPLSHRPSL